MPLRTYGQAFLSRPAARSQRLVGFTVGVLMLLAVAGLSPVAQHAMVPRLAFEPVWLVCLAMCQGFTGLLLGLQASHLRHPTLALLAGAYTFLAFVSGFLLLTFPGVLSVEGWPEITTRVGPWLTLMCRIFFPAWALLAVWRLDKAVPKWLLWLAWLVPSLLALATAVVVANTMDLPTLLEGAKFTRLLHHTLIPITLGINAVALGLVIYQTRLRTRLHLWLCVVLMAQFCATLLGWLSGARLTTGWYGSHVLTAIAGLLLLAALLWDIHDIHRNLQRLNARLHADATHDGLTSLLLRRPFMELLNHALEQLQDRQAPCALIMLDVDHFKAYNDAFGHLAGDACLTAVAQTLKATVPGRLADVSRHGGEEFAVLIRGKAAEQPELLAESLRAAVWREQIQHHKETTGTNWVSISVGVAVARPGMTAEMLFGVVDEALYLAKAAGRNCVRSWPPTAADAG